MAFWSTNDVEPKRNFRFQVEITGLEENSVLWWAKTVTTPAFDVSEVEHNHLDNKYYFPGRVSWNEVSLTLVDPISVDAVQLTNKLVIDSGYVIPSRPPANALDKVTLSKAKSTAAVGDVVISILSASGIPIEIWTLNNAFIKSAKYGDLDYSSDDLRTVEMTFRYDWATCVNTGPDQFTPTS
tara:strand:+ start:1438 stop:1986 length:549 start_codon:yes stop_codon:yes gene_type:complete